MQPNAISSEDITRPIVKAVVAATNIGASSATYKIADWLEGMGNDEKFQDMSVAKFCKLAAKEARREADRLCEQ